MMKTSNKLERDRFISTCLNQWHELGAYDDDERLVQFVLDMPDVSDEDRRLLAIATIADNYRTQRVFGEDVSIERQAEIYLDAFERRSFPLVRVELLKRLTETELVISRANETTKEEYKKRFPEIADFLDEYFECFRSQIYASVQNRSETKSTFVGGLIAPPKTICLSERYDVEALIGSGGQKNVYRAKQESASQDVALKILRDGVTPYADAVNRDAMKSEVVLQARLSHPNIPQILSFDGEGDSPILVERLIPNGTSWNDVIAQKTLEENLTILTTVAQIVAYAHEREHIIHCDLKPSNVMLGESGERFNEVYLVDWGFALSLDDPNLAEKGAGGTIVYMPPESLKGTGANLSFATDVFTLGGILFQILTGKAPYQNVCASIGITKAASTAVANVEIPEIPELNPETNDINPQELIEIAVKALQKDPQDRYQDGSAFVEALNRYRRRANLGERLRRANETFDRLLEMSKNASSNSISPSTLVETANEFRLIREEAATSDARDTPSQLFWNAVKSERAARSLLIESSLKSNDFSLAESQINVLDELNHDVESKSQTTSQASKSYVAEVAQYRSKLQRGIQKRDEERAAKKVVRRLKNEKKLALERAKAAKHIALERTVAPLAAAGWAQGELALYDAANDSEYTASKMNLVERSGIFLEAVGSRNFIPVTVAFSADERYLATASVGAFDSELYETMDVRFIQIGSIDDNSNDDSFVSVASVSLRLLGKRCWLHANPCFRNENADDPFESSRFVFCRDGGVYSFIQFNNKGETRETLVDFRNDVPTNSEEGRARAVWKEPLFFITPNGQRRFVVSDSNGEAFLFSLPDGKLLKRFELCRFEGDAKVILAVADDGKTFFSASSDGEFKRWTTDGEFLETLDLPLGWGVSNLRTIDVSKDGKLFYASDSSGKYLVWNVDAKRAIYEGQEPVDVNLEKKVSNPHTDGFIGFICRIDDERFVTLGVNACWRFWNLSKRDANGNLEYVSLRSPEEHPSGGIFPIAVSPSRRLIAYAEMLDLSFEIYDVDAAKKIASNKGFQKNDSPIVEYDSLSDRILVGVPSKPLIISFDPKTLRVDKEFDIVRNVNNFCISSNDISSNFVILPRSSETSNAEDEFVAATRIGDVCFYKSGVFEPTAVIEKAFSGDEEKSTSSSFKLLAASPNGSFLLGKERTGDEFVLWDLKTRSEIQRWKTNEYFTKENKSGRAHKATHGQELDDELQYYKSELSCAREATRGLFFINEDEALEIKTSGNFVRWNVKTQEVVKISTSFGLRLDAFGNSQECTCCRLSNDRKRLALGYVDGFVSIFDVKTCGTLMASYDWAKNLPNRKVVDVRSTCLDEVFSRRCEATGFAWAYDDSLLCVGFANGKAILLETYLFTPLETIIVADMELSQIELEVNFLNVAPFFTRDAKLITVDSHGFLKRWDFRPSPEKETVLDSTNGAESIVGASRPNLWGRLYSDKFGLYDVDREICSRENLAEFQRLTEPGAIYETFLGLDKDGVLSTFDESGKDVRLNFDPNLNAPEGGFARICASPDRQTIAGIGSADGALYLLSRSNAYEGWRLVKRPNNKYHSVDNAFTQLAFRPDSMELAAVDKDRTITLASLDEKDGENWKTEQIIVPNGDGFEVVYSLSGKYLFQRSVGLTVWIWNVEKHALEQTIKPDVYEVLTYDLASVNALAPLSLELDATGAKRDAFVVASDDGVLRFYNFNESNARFEPTYLLSQTTLGEMIGWKDRLIQEIQKMNPRQETSQPLEFSDNLEFDEAKDINDFSHMHRLFWRWRRCITSLSLSDDQKTLFVGSLGEVYAFDMDEIRRNVAELPEYWRNMDVEKITGLRNIADELQFVERERLLPVVPK